jgi:hypothetical protein
MGPKTADELKDILYQERFDRLDEKLDDIKDMLGNKSSAGSVYRLEEKVKALEESHIPCASLMLVKKEVEDLKLSIKPVIDAADGAVYFAKHPTQLKMVILGGILLLFISAAGIVPSVILWKRYTADSQKEQLRELQLQHELENGEQPKK